MRSEDIILKAIAIVFLCAIVGLSIFWRIDANPLHIWDESRVAVNALEMSQNHNYLIPTYDGKPDMWSVKPPLLVIIQSFSMRLFGYNELGARLPSTIADTATICLLLWFLSYVLKDFLAGFCSVVFLCTSIGYTGWHVARSGDYDALLIFFLTAYFIFAMCFILKKGYRYYLLFNLFLLLALFTKGIAGIFFLPGVFIGFLLQKGAFKKLFRVKMLLPPVFAISCFLSYYLIREHFNAGYIQTVLYEEMQGRMFDSKFNTNRDWYFFFEKLITSAFTPWWVFIPLATIALNSADVVKRKTISIAILTVIIFWVPISVSVNKNLWYDAPSFPLLSIVAALSFSVIYHTLTTGISNLYYRILVFVVPFAVLSFLPLVNTYKNAAYLNERFGFAELVKSKKIPQQAIILSEGYNSPVVFYQKALAIRGTNVLVRDLSGIAIGNTVVAITSGDVNRVKQQFSCDVLYTNKETEMLYLKKKL